MRVAFQCPACRDEILAPPSLEGEAMTCPKCGAEIDRWPAPVLPPGARILPVAPPAPPPRSASPEEDEEEEPPPRRRRRGRGPRVYVCRSCRTAAPPVTRQKVSTAGWLVFVCLLFVFFPLCWVGLLVKDDYLECPYCGFRVA